jgi:hypothetical protein
MHTAIRVCRDLEMTVNSPRIRIPARTTVRTAVRPDSSVLSADLLVAGFAIAGALLLSFLR